MYYSKMIISFVIKMFFPMLPSMAMVPSGVARLSVSEQFVGDFDEGGA